MRVAHESFKLAAQVSFQLERAWIVHEVLHLILVFLIVIQLLFARNPFPIGVPLGVWTARCFVPARLLV